MHNHQENIMTIVVSLIMTSLRYNTILQTRPAQLSSLIMTSFVTPHINGLNLTIFPPLSIYLRERERERERERLMCI